MQGSLIRQIVYQAVRDSIHRNGIDKSSYKAAFDLVTSVDPCSFTLTDSLYCDWGAALAVLQELYIRGRLNKTFAEQIAGLDVHELRASKVKPIILVPHIDHYYVKLLHISKQPLSAKSAREARKLYNEINHTPLGTHPLRPMLFQPLYRPLVLGLRALASFRATATILLLHKYHSQKGEWPKSLAELQIGERSAYSVDPFSGEGYIYKPTPASFLLYSVSGDGIDNGGNHESLDQWGETTYGTDLMFWPIQE